MKSTMVPHTNQLAKQPQITTYQTHTTEEVQMRSQAQNQGQQQQHQGSYSPFQRCPNSGQKNFQGSQNYNKPNYRPGYKSQYNKGHTGLKL